jgi:ATP-dependent DNA helicase RecG
LFPGARPHNQKADEVTVKDIDRDEVFRIVGIIRSIGRLAGPVGKSLPDVLDRLGLRKGGHLLRAAVVLFGKTFLPDYPQCELRMARFRGTDKTEFLDQRQLRGPAFKLLEEAEIFCQRHFPMPAKIVPDQMRRVERALIPPDAMREILVNALIHRDYSIAGGAVSLAIFDDRVEVWSAGRYPTGITAELLVRAHPSVQRNPLIAEVFHRTGLIEKWGRGTNRVAEMCRAVGIAAPEFTEIGGSALVTFRAEVGRTRSGAESRAESGAESGAESLAERIEAALPSGPLSKSEIARALGMPSVTGALNRVIASLLAQGRIALTIPEKKASRLQRYRLVEPSGR